MTDTMKEDNWVNLIKLLCVLIVILGHYSYTEWAGAIWLTHIVKSAVRIMFIYSGYYLRKNNILGEHDKTQKYLKHLGTMATVWVFFYFLRDVGYSEKTWNAVNEMIQSTMYDYIRFDSGHFWFVQNLFLAVAIMFVFQKKHFKVWEIIFLVVLQSCYYWNLLCALTGIGIGFVLAESKKTFDKEALFIWLITAMISAGMLCGFSYGWIHVPFVLENMLIESMKYVLAVSVAVVALCMDALVPIYFGSAGRYIRKLSTVAYLSHNIFVEFTFKVASHYGAPWGDKKFFFYSAGTAILMSFTTGVILIAASEWKPLRILKKIY